MVIEERPHQGRELRFGRDRRKERGGRRDRGNPACQMTDIDWKGRRGTCRMPKLGKAP
ncbi:MAG: hypothetical protein M0C28_40160 [Candidatus Moduliflexus flocculans]|nr:hypothetical protein [Candidatus Moduliflexus flocculans]